MKNMHLVVATVAFAFLCWSATADAYSYNTCNGVAVELPSPSLTFKFDSTCSMPNGSSQSNAAYAAMGEWNNIVNNLYSNGGASPPGCTWSQGDGISEVAIASPSQIGGNNGITFTTFDNNCFWWYQIQHIIEADVLAANTLDFGWPDECWVGSNFHCQTAPLGSQNGTCDIGLGNFTFHHEMGHALGLQHSPGQVIMHNGPPVPYGGGGGGGGGLGDAAAIFPDDAAGARWLYVGTAFHNVMAADTREPSPGADALTVNNASGYEGAGWGVSFFSCPGNLMPLWNTPVNNGTYNEGFNQRIYANTCPSCINGGWTVGTWTGSYENALSLFSSYNNWTVPGGSIPRSQSLWVFLNVDSNDQVQMFNNPNARLWDNYNHYPFVLNVMNAGLCGG